VHVSHAADPVRGRQGHRDAPRGATARAAARLGKMRTRLAGQVAGQVGGEPAPQVARVGVEQHGGGVFAAVRAHRAAEPGIVLGVPRRAGDVHRQDQSGELAGRLSDSGAAAMSRSFGR
jgi:hypothetical protein